MTRQPYVPREPREVKVWVIAPNGGMKPGFYRCRLIKGGPFVPVSLMLIDGDRDELGRLMSDQVYVLRIEDEERDWRKYDGLLGEPVSEDEYDYLCRVRQHDQRYIPALADARKPIDLNALPPVYQRRSP